MKDETRLLLEKAHRAIGAAQTLLFGGDYPDFATGRAYYAMFYSLRRFWKKKGCAFVNMAASMAHLVSNM